MQPGQLLCDRYRIEQALATGGFGETFVAVDTHLPSQPQVVVKLLKPSNSDPATLQIAQRLFEMEAATLEQLGKDNDRIPSLYAYFELRGEFYLVQEYIAGTTLTEELDDRKFSESDTLAILHEILTGLARVHRQNIIHRDLKPDNIIRREIDRKLVLIDFGAVKQVRAAIIMTPNPAVSRTIGIGTEGYMPSEQGIGYPKPASDIYAVGAIGIQCLTGSAPHLLFDEDSLKIEWQHLRRVNPDLAIVLTKMVAPDYRQRYANATEALDAIASLMPSSIPPHPPQPLSTPTPSVTPVAAPVVRSSSVKTVSIPVNREVKTSSRGIDRRNLLKWLGFGGVGVVSAWLLNRVFSNLPELTKIQFKSVMLDSQGKIIDRPSGNAQIFTEDLGNDVKLTMVKIPAGKFLMGSPASEQNRADDESPQHQVSLKAFYLGQTLVTQAQWLVIMGNNPSYFQENDKLPVDRVNWLDAMDFCDKLSQKTGRTYRLPSEAEWEYAARAGTNTPFAFGETITPAVVNYNGSHDSDRGSVQREYSGKTSPVGTFPPNLFGLYDLHGNLWEWCLDESVGNYHDAPTDGSASGDIRSRDKNKIRRLRGGSWETYQSLCRSAFRFADVGSRRDSIIGFRVVCSRFAHFGER
ncbi:bifunctional serine/threonine-protein kinase/formylglycine-generating enzyme family protein [Chamaesiphon polymorphus]|uniref:Protein kinase n=1 Tax=Chamaesiphon polymorphus CCALA 037 TaxID=2107692 RepID=A0A2T1F5D6_9CYAN|nr:bifunctional serine/threonine-protein kinase/formylglycine-generating enzyme family protein [Chamaesiphon polymorphus]PSB40201.1 protein kinase [Chamaesiphon polymorphus CCALA 037]